MCWLKSKKVAGSPLPYLLGPLMWKGCTQHTLALQQGWAPLTSEGRAADKCLCSCGGQSTPEVAFSFVTAAPNGW